MTSVLLPADLTPEAAQVKLAAHFQLADGEVAASEDIFYDTFDGLLHAAGASLVHSRGRLSLVDAPSGTERAGSPSALAPERLLATDLPRGPLRDALAEIVDVRAVLTVARVSSRVRSLSVLDDNGKTVVRVTLEEPSLIASPQRAVRLRGRVRVAPVRGYEASLQRVQDVLSRRLKFQPATTSLAEEAISAAGRSPAGVSSKAAVPLGPRQRSDSAAAAVLSRLLEIIEANLPGTIADIDSEFLHDFRVSIRRSRAVQRELKGVFPPDRLEHFRAELRWLQRSTGDARDLDVYVLGFDSMRELVGDRFRDDLGPLLSVLQGRRLTARREMTRALRSDRASQLLADWGDFLVSLEALPAEGRPDAARPIAELSAERISKVYRRMVKMGRVIDATSPPESYHDLRKKGKELRYLLELFAAPLFPAEVVKPMIKSLKALQDTLGRHQDREVQVATLRSLSREVSSLPGGPAALMAMGLLVDRLGQDERDARVEFASRFSDFASQAQRKLVRETFGRRRG